MQDTVKVKTSLGSNLQKFSPANLFLFMVFIRCWGVFSIKVFYDRQLATYCLSTYVIRFGKTH